MKINTFPIRIPIGIIQELWKNSATICIFMFIQKQLFFDQKSIKNSATICIIQSTFLNYSLDRWTYISIFENNCFSDRKSVRNSSTICIILSTFLKNFLQISTTEKKIYWQGQLLLRLEILLSSAWFNKQAFPIRIQS